MAKTRCGESFPLKIGGGRRDRTDDPLLAKQVLSQLSYAPRHRLDDTRGYSRKHRRQRGGSGWIRTNDPRLIKTVL
jgi:hypothetical protein